MPCRARNIINNPLVDRGRILFPPLHIKLGLIKQFTKALDKDGGCFTYLCHAFSGLTIEKLKAGIFDGPKIPSGHERDGDKVSGTLGCSHDG